MGPARPIWLNRQRTTQSLALGCPGTGGIYPAEQGASRAFPTTDGLGPVRARRGGDTAGRLARHATYKLLQTLQHVEDLDEKTPPAFVSVFPRFRRPASSACRVRSAASASSGIATAPGPSPLTPGPWRPGAQRSDNAICRVFPALASRLEGPSPLQAPSLSCDGGGAAGRRRGREGRVLVEKRTRCGPSPTGIDNVD